MNELDLQVGEGEALGFVGETGAGKTTTALSAAQQVLYGVGNAGVEILTEKMFDGLAGIYGKGGADEIVEGVINRLAKTDRGRSALKIMYSMSGEAVEELFAGAIDPALKSIYNGKKVGENYSRDTAAEIAYSALIGGILGGIGGSVEAMRPNGLYAAQNVTQDASPRISGQEAAQTVQTGGNRAGGNRGEFGCEKRP